MSQDVNSISKMSVQRSVVEEDAGVSLSFKVPLTFRRWFKRQALERNMTMTELLLEATHTYLGSEREEVNPDFRK